MAAIQYPPATGAVLPALNRSSYTSTPWIDPTGKQWLWNVDKGRWSPVAAGTDLIAGTGITIVDGVISATGSTVDDTITDGSTNAVSSNAVFDALALKAPLASPTFAGGVATSGFQSYIVTEGAEAHIATTGATAPIYTVGQNSAIYTEGFEASIYTLGGNSVISTSGQNADICTIGQNSAIHTEGADAYIYTAGPASAIHTYGAAAHISTNGAGSYIQSRSTFKLFNGTYTTTLSHSPTANRDIAFPNDTGTVALTNPSSGTQTFVGTQNFSGQIVSSGSTSTGSTNNILNMGTCDERYSIGKVFRALSYTDSGSVATSWSGLTLYNVPVGTYQIHSYHAISRTSASLSMSSRLSTSVESAARFSGSEDLSKSTSSSHLIDTTTTPTLENVVRVAVKDHLIDNSGTQFIRNSNTADLVFTRELRGILTVTQQTNVSLHYKSIAGSSYPVTCAKGAFLFLTKIA